MKNMMVKKMKQNVKNVKKTFMLVKINVLPESIVWVNQIVNWKTIKMNVNVKMVLYWIPNNRDVKNYLKIVKKLHLKIVLWNVQNVMILKVIYKMVVVLKVLLDIVKNMINKMQIVLNAKMDITKIKINPISV